MKKILRISGFALLALLILGLVGFLIWAEFPAAPEIQAFQSLSDSQNAIFTQTNGWLIFEPEGTAAETGLILYPGGRVDPRAYAPHAHAIAAAGFKVVIVPMPLNFAFLGLERASQVIDTFPEITHWAVGGHSLGGAMAAEYANNNPQKVDGLVLWASYPAENTDLSRLDLAVTSVFAENDGLATPEEVLSAQSRLPADTEFVEIPSGNHAGFGWYGPQRGDGELAITKAAQQEQIVEATILLLAELAQDNRGY